MTVEVLLGLVTLLSGSVACFAVAKLRAHQEQALVERGVLRTWRRAIDAEGETPILTAEEVTVGARRTNLRGDAFRWISVRLAEPGEETLQDLAVRVLVPEGSVLPLLESLEGSRWSLPTRRTVVSLPPDRSLTDQELLGSAIYLEPEPEGLRSQRPAERAPTSGKGSRRG